MKNLLTSIALFLTLVSPLLAETVNAITRISTEEPIVALTFDDGPNGENMRAILKLLEKEDVTATFFFVGKNVKQDPELTKLTHQQGHEIGNHTMTHPRLTKLSIEDATKQIVEMQALLKETTGETPVVFRAPNLDINEEVLAVVAENKLSEVRANRSVGDWQADITREKIIKRASDGIKAGDIILMHSWSGQTREALPQIIATAKAKGLRFVTVSELLAAKKN